MGLLRFERMYAAKADIPANLAPLYWEDLLRGGALQS